MSDSSGHDSPGRSASGTRTAPEAADAAHRRDADGRARDLALVTDPAMARHDPHPSLPEQPRRLRTVIEALQTTGQREDMIALEARQATDDELLRVHTAPYLALVRREVTAGRRMLSTGDTVIHEPSLDAALLAAGACTAAVDAVCGDHPARRAFCVVRPPGHHAGPDYGMGFCLFNNIAVAARHALPAHSLDRVAIIDWDVHHGNGTQDVFYHDGDVFFFSLHQSPWYPGTGAEDETGAEDGRGSTMNRPLPAGSGRRQVEPIFHRQLLPALKQFAPQLILISAGFDSRQGDPLGQFELIDRDFFDLTRMLLDFAADHGGGRVVSVLEGGYALPGLASASAAHVAALLGRADPPDMAAEQPA